MSAVKVLFIAGWGHSGSTIIDNLLGQVEGFFSTGELHALWRGGLIEANTGCGCGEAIADCDLWRRVLRATMSEATSANVAEIAAWQKDALRMTKLRRLVQADDVSSLTGAARVYADWSIRLYSALADVTGARVIVDSSKTPTYPALLRLSDGIDLYLVHLVRDPRAVANSWRRIKRFGVAESSLRWTVWNQATAAVARRLPPRRSLVLRYEDFLAHPRHTIRTLVSFVDEPARRLPFQGERRAVLGTNHSVGGNKSRFLRGHIDIADTRDWRKDLSLGSHVAATIPALPAMGPYGYRLNGRAKRLRKGAGGATPASELADR